MKNIKSLTPMIMKKLFSIFTIFLISALFLTACATSNEDDQSADVKPVSTNISGILTLQTESDVYLGTHLLTNSSGEIFSLRSLRLNLSDKNYLNNKVQLTGISDDDDVFNVEGITVLEVIKNDKNAELVEYKNTDFGFKLEYYDNWEVDEASSSISFNHKDGDKVVLTQHLFAYVPTISEDGESDTAFEAYFAGTSFEDLESMTQEIGELQAIKVEGEASRLEYYFYRSGYIYEIDFIPSSDDLKNKNTFLEMLNSFEFTGFTIDSDSGDENPDDVHVDGMEDMDANEDSDEDENSDADLDNGEGNEDVNGDDKDNNDSDDTDSDDQDSDSNDLNSNDDVDTDSNSDNSGNDSANSDENTSSASIDALPELSSFNTKAVFTSDPYSFQMDYHSAWYYGVGETPDGALRHYSFGPEDPDETNEFLGLDIVSSSYDSIDGASLTLDNGREIIYDENSDKFEAVTFVGDYAYVISADPEYKDLILNMLASVELMEEEAE